jgi:hypothetical protein
MPTRSFAIYERDEREDQQGSVIRCSPSSRRGRRLRRQPGARLARPSRWERTRANARRARSSPRGRSSPRPRARRMRAPRRATATSGSTRCRPLRRPPTTARAARAISASSIHSIRSPARSRWAIASSASPPRQTPKVTRPLVCEANAWVDTTTTAPATASATLLMKRWLISDSSSLSRTGVHPRCHSGSGLGIAANPNLVTPASRSRELGPRTSGAFSVEPEGRPSGARSVGVFP